MTNTPGNNQQLTIICDADALIALVNSQDALHEGAVHISQRLTNSQAHILYPITAVIEAVTNLQRALSNPELAASLLDLVFENESAIISPTTKLLHSAKSLFDPQGSKKNTIFDCLIVAYSKHYQADYIFSFDKWYQKLGLKLTSKLINS